MLLIIHNQSKFPLKVLNNGAGINFEGKSCTSVLLEMAKKYPKEIIGWCEADFVQEINTENWEEIFHHDLVMASYAIENSFFPTSLGYIDQLPFINVNRKVSYGTWQMSSDVGGIKGEVLLRFEPLFGKIKDFSYLLNCIAKVGQQNGLFCYSEPKLIKNYDHQNQKMAAPAATATKSQLFAFIYQFYKTTWVWVLLWCYFKYENQFPVFAAAQSFFREKLYLAPVNLSGIKVASKKKGYSNLSIDVVIPTMGRPEHLVRVLEDLGRQSHPPKKVIVVEQDPDPNSQTALPELQTKSWPFEIKHHFIHQTGACNARNLAMAEAGSDWVFFADDDIRFSEGLLDNTLKEMQRLNCKAISLNSKQKGERTIFKKIKQWGSFGTAASIVKTSEAKKCHFSLVFEHGYGEDVDFGMQLRNLGVDIIYHPQLEILHLKAPMGGFREKSVMPWENARPRPKPAPTVLVHAQQHFSPPQLKGYKTSLFLKYYRKQPIKNPFKYVREMKKRWKISEGWAKKIKKKSGTSIKLSAKK